MQTRDARAIRRMREASLLSELPAGDPGDALAAVRPMLDRVRRGEWRLLVIGPTCARERDEAATFSARLLDLADVVGGRM